MQYNYRISLYENGGIIMACFIAPVTEAVITTIAEKVIHSRERRAESE